MLIEHSHLTEVYNLRNTSPSMTFDPKKESFESWKSRAQSKLYDLLGLNKFVKTEDNFKIEYDVHEKNYRKIRFLFKSEEHCSVPCYLIIPDKKQYEKLPVMICLQGHGTGMHISLGEPKYDIDKPKVENGDRDFAVQCVEKGYCALVIEQRCFGERGGNPRPDCHSAALTAIMSGRTLVGGRVWDIMRGIDILENHFAEYCDTDKIYCMGNSGGGTATFYACAMEERIKGAMPSCAFCTFADSIGTLHHCACNYIPHIAEYFDMAEIAGIAAPRPVVVVSGITDGIFPINGAETEFERLKEIYAASGYAENCIHVKGNEGHRFYAAEAWKAFQNMI